MKLSGRAAAVVVLFFLPLGAAAQLNNSNSERFNRQLEQIQRDTLLQPDQNLSLQQREFFDYGAYTTIGYLSTDDNNNNNHVLRQYELTGYARLNLDGAQEFFLRGTLNYQDFNDGDEFEPNQEGLEDPQMDRWYYKFDLAKYESARYGKRIDYNLSLEAGRDLQVWGNGLVLSSELEGVTATGSWGGSDLTMVAGVTPVRTVDFDSSRPSFDHNTRRGFYGLMLSHDISGHRPYVYGLLQRDYNTHDEDTTGPVTTKYDYNSYYLGAGVAGPVTDRLLYSAEFAYEGGTNLSNSFTVGGGFLNPVPQTRDQIQAFAGDFRLDYVFPDEHHSRLSGELILASGDDDRGTTSNTFGGNKPGTNDRAFNAFGLLNTGLAFAPAVSNMLALRVGGSTFPFLDHGPLRRLQVGSDIFLFNKLEADAPIDEQTSDQRYLGWEPDFFLNWQITSDFTLVARYGIFFPSSDAFSDDTARQYIYGGFTYAF